MPHLDSVSADVPAPRRQENSEGDTSPLSMREHTFLQHQLIGRFLERMRSRTREDASSHDPDALAMAWVTRYSGPFRELMKADGALRLLARKDMDHALEEIERRMGPLESV